MADTNMDHAEFERLDQVLIQQEARVRELAHTQAAQGQVLREHSVKLDTQSTKLDQIVTAVTKFDARPAFDLQKTVSMVRDVFVVCATLASLSVWLIVTLTSADQKLVDFKIGANTRAIERLQELFPAVSTAEKKVNLGAPQ